MWVALTYSCEALQEHEGETDGHAVSDTLLEKLLELCLLAHTIGTALLDLRANLTHLMLDVCVRRVKVTDFGQDLLGSLEVVTTGQPT